MPSNTDDLQRAWVHSHEEDSGNVLVYRPADFDFPPARGRDALDLRPGGELRYGGPGPDDRPVSLTGKWTFDGNAVTLEVPGRNTERLTVQSIEPDKLILSR